MNGSEGYAERERTLLESVEEAIAAPGSTGEYATPGSALRWLLTLTWGDLQSARYEAANGIWSIRCAALVDRIIGITHLVGPLPWDEVPVDLLLDGVYERIHEAIGTPTPLSDEARRRAQEVKDRRGNAR